MDAQLDRLNSVLDALEERNDRIHSIHAGFFRITYHLFFIYFICNLSVGVRKRTKICMNITTIIDFSRFGYYFLNSSI